ncbi:iron complex transport system ATP-binding protein [Paenibacillus tianmuensis]|uniref:Iron complex transport system ATP-binding protein n=1 Tax=Paenibacillus tianmuensis TaxID=624147 RepID=A0A1G4RB23_9BACL|nr:ABC transporter ATP-binding protein [Paenibacillus tianmuensis]SCW53449.1 iron complex transport system ATP-binding protein [Paenibacillus tianmuensis]
MKVEVQGLSYDVKGEPIIQGVDLQVHPGEFVGIIGPNGSGKSTLLKNIYRVLKPQAGWISLDGQQLSELTHKETAQRMAVVSQETSSAFDFTVRDIVLMGRHPHKRMFAADTREDDAMVSVALERVGMESYARRSFSSLSGGEKQRVLIARALAQQSQFLIMDEPTNHLDIRHQLQMMDLVKTLGMTALSALHDLNMASYFCDRLIVMNAGKVYASGTPEEVMSAELLRQVFGVNAQLAVHPVTRKLSITYFPESLLSHLTPKGALIS